MVIILVSTLILQRIGRLLYHVSCGPDSALYLCIFVYVYICISVFHVCIVYARVLV